MSKNVSTHRKVVTVAGLLALACMIVGVGYANAGSGTVPGAVTGLASSTHPVETTWYSNNSPAFTWNPTTATSSPIAGYSVLLDQKADSVPDTTTDRQSLDFLPRVPYTVGTNPAEDRLVDLNGDGKLDLVVENSGSNTVSVLLGNGNGTFKTAVNYATGTKPWSMAVGDVNGDGKPDIVTGNTDASTASVLLNKGDGTFSAHVDYPTGSAPECLRLGDVNSDGKLDIVAANSTANTVSVLLGNGNGTFATKTDFTTSTHPTSIDLGDVNGDGKTDLVTANYDSNNVSVLTGKGNGSFNTHVDYATGKGPETVIVADVNKDGKLDIETVNGTDSSASILLNNGDGTFKAKVDYATGGLPYSLAVADLNQDGAVDLVTSNHTGNSLSILFGNGDGTFEPKIDKSIGNGPFWIALGDLNGDGYGDLVSTDETDGTASVLLGTAYLATSYSNKADGIWYFHVRAVDATGTGGPTTTRAVRIDTTPPVTTQTGADSAWHASAVTMNLSATDALNGVAKTEYKVDSGSWTTGTTLQIPAPTDGSNNGSHTVSYRSTDTIGNQETAKTSTVNIVTTAPTTTVSGADGAWHASNVTLSLSSTSPGVTKTEYSLDGGTTWTTGTSVVIAAAADGSNDGAHTVLYRSTNGAGFVEAAKSCTVDIDVAAPVTSVTGADGAWHNSAVTLVFAGNDGPGSGVAKTEYSLDNGTSWTTGTSVVIAAGSGGSNDGPHTVLYRSTDVAGHTETAKSCVVKIDTSAPTASQTGADSAWHRTPVTVTFSGSDAVSGFACSQYKVDGGDWTTGGSVVIAAPADGSNDGSHAVLYRSVDVAGNAGPAQSCTVLIDRSAPVTTASGDDTAWSNVPVTVTFTSTDTRSGIALTQYSLDGGTTWTAGGSVVIAAPSDGSNDGTHTVLYTSTDNVGNVETVHTRIVNICTQAPTTTASGADSAWHAGPVTIDFAASGRGAVSTQYSLDGGTTWTTGDSVVVAAPSDGSNDGTHTVLYRSTDAAGNVELPQSCTVKIDAGPPVTSVSGADSSWHAGPVTVGFAASDAGSGVASTEYSLDGGATWTAGTSVVVQAPLDGSNDGSHTIEYRSTDYLGHTETAGSCTVKIDATPPTTTVSGADGAWHTSAVTLNFAAGDASGSGVAATEYSLDGGVSWTAGTSVVIAAPASGANDGIHTVEYRSTDAAGNVEPYKSCTVKIDTNAPVTVDNASASWHAVPFMLVLTAHDVGGTTTQYSVSDDTHWRSGSTVAFSTAWKRGGGSGPVMVYYRSTNEAGLVEAEKSVAVLIDTSRPCTRDDAPSGPQAADVTVHLTGTDTFSGVAQTWYQVDSGAWQPGTSVLIPALAAHGNDGLHTIRYYSVDYAGNTEAGYRVCTVRIVTP